jgi:hypothetical protein
MVYDRYIFLIRDKIHCRFEDFYTMNIVGFFLKYAPDDTPPDLLLPIISLHGIID